MSSVAVMAHLVGTKRLWDFNPNKPAERTLIMFEFSIPASYNSWIPWAAFSLLSDVR